MPFQLPSVNDLPSSRYPFLEASNSVSRTNISPNTNHQAMEDHMSAYESQEQRHQQQLVIPDVLSSNNSYSEVLSNPVQPPSLRDYDSTSTVTTSLTANTNDSIFDKSTTAHSPPKDSLTPTRSPEGKSPERSGNLVKLARRRVNRVKERSTRRNINNSKPQGRPLSKETRVRLTLVPTLGILYSILVSDTMKKTLNVVKYGPGKESIAKTNEELSTRNVTSGFASLLNVQSVRFLDEQSQSPNRDSSIPEFNTIDDAALALFGVPEYSLIRVTRAAATEVGGSVLLKIETAMPGHFFLIDDEDEDFHVVESKKNVYQDSIGSIGDRPTTTFLKKRAARPRYKSDMRIYLIPRTVSCAIYCEIRMLIRDLLRGFLDMKNLDRSIIIAFEYSDLLKELEEGGLMDLASKYSFPSLEEVKALEPEPAPESQNDSYNQPAQQARKTPQASQASQASQTSQTSLAPQGHVQAQAQTQHQAQTSQQSFYVLNPTLAYNQPGTSLSPQQYLAQGSFHPAGQFQQFDPNGRYPPFPQQSNQISVSAGYPSGQFNATFQIPANPQPLVQPSLPPQQQQQMGYQPISSNVYDPQQFFPSQGINGIVQNSYPVSGQAGAFQNMDPLAVGQQSPIAFSQNPASQFYSPAFNNGQGQYIHRDPKGQVSPPNGGYQPM